jgi:poly(hydroxyalkanoate) depolymerase family esterase
MYRPLEPFAEALRLTRTGELAEATRVIQRALRGRSAAPDGPVDQQQEPSARQASSADAVEDVVFREAMPAARDDVADAPAATPAGQPAPAEVPQDVVAPVDGAATDAGAATVDTAASARTAGAAGTSNTVETGEAAQAPAAHLPEAAHAASSFEQHQFRSGSHHYRYRLFIPAGRPGPRPVLVLLHGCKQDSADFATGTGMNPIAQQHDCIVVYPEQLRNANQMGCWNWFEPAHQRRGAGEPEMIAALARDVAARHGGDPQRIYVAGLSAGGAMAALVAHLYPEVFAAVGIHSGLAPASAHDVVSAFAAMRKGKREGAPSGSSAVLPTIVFHGSADKTVHPVNGNRIVEEALAGLRGAGVALQRDERRDDSAAARAATCTRYLGPDGTPLLEQWEIAAGPHAWSGGDPGGSFTDPQGPSASREMLRFFLRHRRAPHQPWGTSSR